MADNAGLHLIVDDVGALLINKHMACKKTPNKIGRIKYTDRNYTTPYNIIVKVQQSEKEKEIGGKSWRSSVKKK